MLRSEQLSVEQELLEQRPDIVETISSQQRINERMKQGNVPAAIEIQRQHRDKQKLLQYNNN